MQTATQSLPSRSAVVELSLFSGDEVTAINDLLETYPVVPTHSLHNGERVYDKSKRHCISRLPPRDNDTAWIYTRLDAAVVQVSGRNDLSFQRLYHLIYPVGGHFYWHVDHYWPRGGEVKSKRWLNVRWTATVQLSAPQEYDGGELEFRDGGYVAGKELGLGILFPAHRVWHRVTPVERGHRRALAGWASLTNGGG